VPKKKRPKKICLGLSSNSKFGEIHSISLSQNEKTYIKQTVNKKHKNTSSTNRNIVSKQKNSEITAEHVDLNEKSMAVLYADEEEAVIKEKKKIDEYFNIFVRELNNLVKYQKEVGFSTR
jgi:hypothetical protein